MVKYRDVIRRIQDDGWYPIPRTAGSHQQFKHPTKKGRVTISRHRDGADVLPQELKSILKQAGLKGMEEE